MTSRQVAELAQVDTSTVRRWVAAGHLVPTLTTPGGQMRFAREDVERMLTAGRASAGGAA